jgi:hypothetical protein
MCGISNIKTRICGNRRTITAKCDIHYCFQEIKWYNCHTKATNRDNEGRRNKMLGGNA